jgi:hypothetical protein
LHRADRIANRLHDMWKGTTKAKWEFPPKPSRMRRKTYRRLQQQYEELQGQWAAGVMAGTAQLLQRLRRGSKP